MCFGSSTREPLHSTHTLTELLITCAEPPTVRISFKRMQYCGSALVSMRIRIHGAKTLQIRILVRFCRYWKLNFYMNNTLYVGNSQKIFVAYVGTKASLKGWKSLCKFLSISWFLGPNPNPHSQLGSESTFRRAKSMVIRIHNAEKFFDVQLHTYWNYHSALKLHLPYA